MFPGGRPGRSHRFTHRQRVPGLGNVFRRTWLFRNRAAGLAHGSSPFGSHSRPESISRTPLRIDEEDPARDQARAFGTGLSPDRHGRRSGKGRSNGYVSTSHPWHSTLAHRQPHPEGNPDEPLSGVGRNSAFTFTGLARKADPEPFRLA